jgi:hypothetical protein
MGGNARSLRCCEGSELPVKRPNIAERHWSHVDAVGQLMFPQSSLTINRDADFSDRYESKGISAPLAEGNQREAARVAWKPPQFTAVHQGLLLVGILERRCPVAGSGAVRHR